MSNRSGRPDDVGMRCMVIILPGLSLMDIQQLAVGVVVVRCPACGASQLFAAAPNGEMREAAFVHWDEHCPIRLRVERAIAKARAAHAYPWWN